MAKLLVQVVAFSGKIIENGKWVVDIPAGVQEGQSISLSMPIKDPALLRYLGKQQLMNCVIDKEDDNRYMVSVACKVMRIRHMINTATQTAESMATVMPEDRTCEHVLTYLLAPKMCDPRFVTLVRGQQPAPPA